MERLTFKGNFCDIAQCRELPCKHGGNCSQKQVWERLKAYEDAGLSPQACAEARETEEGLSSTDYSISRMLELMKADKDGRVVVLPCKVTDELYVVGKKQIVGCDIAETYLNDDGTIEYLVNFECGEDCTGCPFDSWERGALKMPEQMIFQTSCRPAGCATTTRGQIRLKRSGAISRRFPESSEKTTSTRLESSMATSLRTRNR